MGELRIQQRPHLADRVNIVAKGSTTHERTAGCRPIKPEDQSHGRRLPSPIGAKKRRHLSGVNPKRQIIEGEPITEPLRQVLDLDHRGTLPFGDCERPRRRLAC
ncbi:hypothetical protein BKA04_001384 [Cryobacterium mesophilum]|nr:hypothetical protein [Terrimesophilobacter mesophilus]